MATLRRIPLFFAVCTFALGSSTVAADEVVSGKPVSFVMGVKDKLPTTADGWFGKSFTFKVDTPGPFKVIARPRGTGRVVFIELFSPAKKSLGAAEGKELRIPELPANGEYQLNISSRDVGDITFTATFDGHGKDSPSSNEVEVAAEGDVLAMIDALDEEVSQMEQQLASLRKKLENLRRAAQAAPRAKK